MSQTKIDRLTDDQHAAMDGWADKWIEIGLRTGPADRPKFEQAVHECYRYAGLDEPRRIVWVESPLVMALAAPIAATIIARMRSGAVRGAVGGAIDAAVRNAVDVVGAVGEAVDGAVLGAVGGAVHEAIDGAVGGAVGGAVHAAVDNAVVGAVHGAVGGAIDDAVGGAVGDAVYNAVDDAVRGAFGNAVGNAVDEAVGNAVSNAVHATVRDAADDAVRATVHDAVDDAVHGGVRDAVHNLWWRYLGGQFWVGGYWWGGAWSSFFREICHLDLPGDLWDRARAYEATMESACWWWPHREFVMVCERPSAICREVVNLEHPRGWGSHRLHCPDGPAIVWPDGWGVYMWHGVRVPRQVIEAPETLTVTQILDERNAEVRRIMLERFGLDRFIRELGADPISEDHVVCRNAEWCTHTADQHRIRLYRAEISDDEPLVMVDMVNATPEPDGSWKRFMLRVPPSMTSAREAMAWTWVLPSDEYQPVMQS